MQQYEHDLTMIREQYKDAIEENGRLEARIQAFAINAQSEQDVLSSEVISFTLVNIIILCWKLILVYLRTR